MREMTKYHLKNEKSAEEHGLHIGDFAVYGQESNSTTRRLAMKFDYSKVTSRQASTNKPVKRKPKGADA